MFFMFPCAFIWEFLWSVNIQEWNCRVLGNTCLVSLSTAKYSPKWLFQLYSHQLWQHVNTVIIYLLCHCTLFLLFLWKDINFDIKPLEIFNINIHLNRTEILGFNFSHLLSADQTFILCWTQSVVVKFQLC